MKPAGISCILVAILSTPACCFVRREYSQQLSLRGSSYAANKSGAALSPLAEYMSDLKKKAEEEEVTKHPTAQRQGIKNSTASSDLKDANKAGIDEHVTPGVYFPECSAQSPSNSSWWMTAAQGHEAPTAMPSKKWEPYYGSVPGKELTVCLPPKNGCTYWKALLMRMNGHPSWNDADPHSRHNPDINGLTWSTAGLDTPSVTHEGNLAVMLVRNPITRVLSAYLDKSQDVHGVYTWMHEYTDRYGKPYRQGFADWVTHEEQLIIKGESDAHWRRQSDICGINFGAKWDLYLKVECRQHWGPSLFDRYNMHQWTDDGWGADEKQPFIATDEENNIKSTWIEGVQHNSVSGKHNRGGTDLEDVCEYYWDYTFVKVVRLYAKEIKSFGYLKDVRSMANSCGFKDSMRLLNSL